MLCDDNGGGLSVQEGEEEGEEGEGESGCWSGSGKPSCDEILVAIAIVGLACQCPGSGALMCTVLC